MTKQIRLNAFAMNTVGHLSPGLWRHPRDQATRYTDIHYWIELAQTLERGCIDGLFLADVLGVYDVYGGNADEALRSGAQVPLNDPLQLVPAMAAATRHLGFGVTASVSFEHPFPFARRMSTLDHLTQGRAGWNIVTSYLSSGARNLGQPEQLSHDQRYALAEEYLQVCYKLWETSWEEDAVRADRTSGVYTDPSKVHGIEHDGTYFKVPGFHLSAPSPQRTPVLYQAGASSRGRAFAAANAECVFVAAPSKTVLKKQVSDLRAAAVAAGRKGSDILILEQLTVIVAETDEAAQARLREYREYASASGSLSLMSGWTGIDFAAYSPDQILREVPSEAIQSVVEGFTRADPTRTWTVAEIAEYCCLGGDGPLLVGSPSTVADQLQAWVEDTDVDGFNLSSVVVPETFVAVVDLLVPELQARGLFKREYAEGSLRNKLFGQGDRLRAPHPVAALRQERGR
ncbi:LLM class flavin-dependent oxidoreductase [Pseudomonas putida]|uniref:LLM class flavin-dependent oxidoreductase n=1 Tax=Pseudomonas putida TaxID=303 RepID=UPI0008191AF0|nr:LLM class flavin-dependent oxidoreductase [Pseudomonas putida]OCT29911.1 5,10-methylene tetrahydromethanopterin reductase [Pseudomonas putida]OCT31609.1 5,10-methylene tetrahydromethanopterin reductase [Pseudomonas putida]OCT33851.1 5,10-methylene tetrahydromethanopterin reductase [Pseudomonas putida]OCT40296.1 5,10-methylene tetrahydromethanopterin reductase [Pseudomonas putida]